MSGATQGHDDHAASSHDLSHAGGDQGHHADAHGDDHGHGGEALGPIDVKAWGAAVLGIAGGLLVAGALFVTMNPS